MTHFRDDAAAVLRENRRDGYTVPSPRLYPFQWNWDSAFIALGLRTVDPEAARRELTTLFDGQWENGMLPQIIFWDESAEGYFPGPEEWDVRTADDIATSGITQPPIAVTAVQKVFEATGDEAFRDALLPAIDDLLSWWVRERSFDGRTVYIRHPWESGMDDSPAWQTPLGAFDPGSPRYNREDLKDESLAAERPTDWDYDRYVRLYRQARELKWDEARIREVCPFLVEDVLTNGIFVRACEDLAALYESAGEVEAAARWRDQRERSGAAIRERLWDADLRTFVSYDRTNDERLRENSIAGFVPALSGIPTEEQAGQMLANLRENFGAYGYTLPTYVGEAMDLDRYWRGPIWINTNWLVETGLRRYDPPVADRIREDSLSLIETEGFVEYFNPKTGEGRGSDRFSWTAALYLDWTDGAEPSG